METSLARSRPFRFGYVWRIEGPIDTVFYYVSDARTFPEWFYVFTSVKTDEGDEEVGVGSHADLRVRAALPYSLDWDITVTEYNRPHLLTNACRLRLSGGIQLRGYVRFRFEQDGPVVTVTNEQELAPERPWPAPLHWLAQRAFTFNHHWAMGRAQPELQRIVRAAAGRPT